MNRQVENAGRGRLSPSALLSVFTVSLVLCTGAAIWGILAPEQLAGVMTSVTTSCLGAFDWAFLLSITVFILFSLFLAFGRTGNLKLGRPDDTPEFSTVSWIAMLFAAGMGAGLLFWGVAEPLTHYVSPPPGGEPMTEESARFAMVITNLHWGIHAWGIYATGALVLGYYGFRHGMPLIAGTPIRSALPGKSGSALGYVADLVAVVAVAFGIAGSLGLGVIQINSGLAEFFPALTNSAASLLVVLIVLVVFYMIPVSTPLDRGIKLLSNMNVAIVVALMLFVLFFGPTASILATFVTSLGDYLTSIVNLSFRLQPYSGETEWVRGWTLTYLIWWIAWTPFVGVFVARISRGRTIREFVLTVVLVPTFFSILWFAVFGGSGLFIERFGVGGLGTIVLENPSSALFVFFRHFPLAGVLTVVTLFLVFVFLSTSAASGAFVLAMMTSRGAMEPARSAKLFWGGVVAALAAAILFSGGEVSTMRAIAVSGALPFALIMVMHLACICKTIARDFSKQGQSSGDQLHDHPESAAVVREEAHVGS